MSINLIFPYKIHKKFEKDSNKEKFNFYSLKNINKK